MKNDKKKGLAAGVGLIAVFFLWTVMVRTADVRPVGPNGTDVGFAAINTWFHELTGVHMGIYKITDWLGLVPIAVCAGFGALGLKQLVQRRSLKKVDMDILILGAYYLIVIFCYLFFETVRINYRPVLIDGALEASYPSSTTLLVLSVMPTLVFQAYKRLGNAFVKRIIFVCALAFTVLMVAGRLVSGVHWLTDIAGAALLSAGLFMLYRHAVDLAGQRRSE